MRTFLAGLLLIASIPLAHAGGREAAVAIHPAPKKPTMLPIELEGSFRKEMPPPPASGSDAQRRDERELLELQAKRVESDCVRARSEVYVGLAAFFGGPGGILSEAEVSVLNPFFDKIRNDVDYYIQLLKKEFPRKRPHLYVTGISPCVPREVTGAYPSGHATLSKLYALILGDFFPARKAALLMRADQISLDRVIGGMHHPSDIEAGKRLAVLAYDALKRSRDFGQRSTEIRNKLSNR